VKAAVECNVHDDARSQAIKLTDMMREHETVKVMVAGDRMEMTKGGARGVDRYATEVMLSYLSLETVVVNYCYYYY